MSRAAHPAAVTATNPADAPARRPRHLQATPTSTPPAATGGTPTAAALTGDELLDCWQLLRQATTTTRARLTDALNTAGSRPDVFAVLHRLLHVPGHRQTLTAVGQHCGFSSGTMTVIADRLDHNGWAHREHHHDDRRLIWLKLTPAGAAEASRLQPAYLTSLRTVLHSALNHDELTELTRLCQALTDAHAPGR